MTRPHFGAYKEKSQEVGLQIMHRKAMSVQYNALLDNYVNNVVAFDLNVYIWRGITLLM